MIIENINTTVINNTYVILGALKYRNVFTCKPETEIHKLTKQGGWYEVEEETKRLNC